MTVTEAHHVNILCRHILGSSAHGNQSEPSPAEVRAALEHLANQAYARLLAGFDGRLVRERWDGPHTYEPRTAVVDAVVELDRAVERGEGMGPHFKALVRAARRGL